MTTPKELDPLDFLLLANELVLRAGSSAAVRTACDRAYYAAFLYARDQLGRLGYATPHRNTRDHQYIPGTLRRLPGGVGHGNDLLRLFRQRKHYTYDTEDLSTVTASVSSPQWVLSTATRIIGFVQRLGT